MTARIPALAALLAAASLAPAAAADPAPALRAHSIFGAPGFHVGALVEADGGHGGGKITRLCVSPAPIDRPGCGSATTFAPSATGTTTLKATLAGGGTATLALDVRPAATALGGYVPVRGHVTCAPTKLYGNEDRRHGGRLVGQRGMLPASADVALYNRLGKGRFVWSYAGNRAGIAPAGCLARGLAAAGKG